MNALTQSAILGIDVSKDHLDSFFLSSGEYKRWLNTPKQIAALVAFAQKHDAEVCFEATGGLEWPLWEALVDAGVKARQLPPARIKAFAKGRGIGAKTDRLDSETIAHFGKDNPNVGRIFGTKKQREIRALVRKRSQLVNMRKSYDLQVRAEERQGTDYDFKDVNAETKAYFNSQIAALDRLIIEKTKEDKELAQIHDVLSSIPGFGPVVTSVLIAELPEMGTCPVDKLVGLVGLAPLVYESGKMKRRSKTGKGRPFVKKALYQAAMVASRVNPLLKAFADKLKERGKPHKVIIIAIARKLLTLACALHKKQTKWQPDYA